MKFNNIFKRCMASFCALFIVLSSFAISVFADTDSYGNEFLNVNDYAKYSTSADGTKVNASLSFPADWTITNVFWDYVGNTFGASDLTLTGNNINLHNESTDGYFSLCMYPYNRSISVGVGKGYQIRNSKILDLRYLPSDSYFSYDFYVKVKNPTSATTEFSGTLREDLVYVDKDGKILQHDINYIPSPPNYNDNGYRVIHWGGTFSTRPVDGAVGLIPFFSLRNITCDWDTDIIVEYNGLRVSFSMSNLDYENIQNGMLADTIESVKNDIGDVKDSIDQVENKIDNAISGTPEQNQQVNNSLGGLNSSTDKLGALGDQMSSVNKPEIDSNQISADSLVPHTALVALSSPFQALWENNQLLAILTIVVTLVLVSWVFFGKKG